MSKHTALGTTECTILEYFMIASCAESSDGAPVQTIFPLANMSAVVEGVLSLNFAAAKLSGPGAEVDGVSVSALHCPLKQLSVFQSSRHLCRRRRHCVP